MRVKDRKVGEVFLVQAALGPGKAEFVKVALVSNEYGEYIVRRNNGERVTLDGYELTQDA